MKKKLLFIITQFYKGGAETSLLNLFRLLSPEKYEVDFIILNQIEYRDVTSLVEYIPDWIQVYDLIKSSRKVKLWEQIGGKVYRRLFHAETYGNSAVAVVKHKKYDAAFSFGEWLSPEFIAKKVDAKHKYVWIHIDLDKADFVNKKELVKYDDQITGYIFASQKSMTGAIASCPEMKKKSYVVHNFLNRKDIQKKAEEKIDQIRINKPYLLSVGNLRLEKNYPRQVEVMKLLKEHKNNIMWICIGSTVDKVVFEEVKELLEKYNLQQDFILCGANDNPYKYMSHAEAVMVLSDHESWSLVISEAKILGVPVIATKTSGAQEQIVNGKTGIITSFEVEDIVNSIEQFINNDVLRKSICMNLENELFVENGLNEFEALIRE